LIDIQVRTNVLRAVDSLKDELVQLVRDMVRIPSVTPVAPAAGSTDTVVEISSETLVNHALKPIMESFGLETDLWEVERRVAPIWWESGAGKEAVVTCSSTGMWMSCRLALLRNGQWLVPGAVKSLMGRFTVAVPPI
jgi:acetylornithine deacetylase/succinyl-diaminopimelate desuccinylase-like protein